MTNFHCIFESDSHATAAWVCILYAHDGEAPQMTAPPINISLVTDICVLEDGVWLVKRRTWKALFRGGVPGTVLTPEEKEKRLAAKGA